MHLSVSLLSLLATFLYAETKSLRSRHAARLLREHINSSYYDHIARSGRSGIASRDISLLPPLSQNSSSGPLTSFNLTDPTPFPSSNASDQQPPLKICVVGAGVAGLYLAWMLTFLRIPYDLLEASPRVGGRAFTYRFPGDSDAEGRAEHNYYDVGAMRFPKIDALQPVFTVFEKLGVRTERYYLDNPSAPWSFDQLGRDGGVNTMADALQPFQDAVSPFINLLIQDFDSGFDHLVKTADQYSTREYLHSQAGLGFNEIQRLETFDTGTGLFDQAFSESVLDWYDFATAKSWMRIENGTSVLADAMLEQLASQPVLNTKVIAITMADAGGSVKVTSANVISENQAQEKYAAVFSTTSLGCLQRIDLGGLPIEDAPYTQWTAIRSLHYDNSAKVAIKFRSAWWVTLGGMTPLGGASAVDTPIRMVVYPPWMDKDDPTKPAVLVASYTWAQDATRISSLISRDSPLGEDDLMDIVLRNLVNLFSKHNITLEFLQSQVISHHAFSWSQNPNTAGAFALFGPGQFTSLYPSLVRPLSGSQGRVHVVGEHASAHHAWMSGPMYSAATSLYIWLSSGDQEQRVMAAKLKDSWFGDSIEGEEVILQTTGFLGRNETSKMETKK